MHLRPVTLSRKRFVRVVQKRQVVSCPFILTEEAIRILDIRARYDVRHVRTGTNYRFSRAGNAVER